MTTSAAPVTGRIALVVDDSVDQGDLLRLHLERLGYEVALVGTAEAAIESYRRLEPAVAIIDLMLPGIDGWQLVRTMKQEVPECVLIVTSVLGLEDFPIVDGVLPKPFTAADVAATLALLFPAAPAADDADHDGGLGR
ncbi:response regulator [Herbiconiux sp. CPCC 205716]|uniref:Response regulator n=1 Tax=Herbiconiux gentiana TaxID=2970912 RepID=A0ABT2GDI5_9MICO|nr:response regulator [Herbiconiux gentiana]MCS5713340.1 response regulator [Herbiconiux gentiana]